MVKRYSAPNLFMSCDECGKLLIETTSGYLTCPKGHGKLLIAEPDIPEADTYSMFIDDLEPVDGVS